jgi:hypothetical protein
MVKRRLDRVCSPNSSSNNKIAHIENAPCYLDKLPTELIHEIFELILDDSKKKMRILTVSSKYLNELFRAYQDKYYNLVGWDNDKYIQHILKCKCCVGSIYFASLSLYNYSIYHIKKDCNLSEINVEDGKKLTLVINPKCRLYIDSLSIEKVICIIGKTDPANDENTGIVVLNEEITIIHSIIIDNCTIEHRPSNDLDIVNLIDSCKLNFSSMDCTYILSRCLIFPIVKLSSGRLNCKSCKFDSSVPGDSNQIKSVSLITGSVTSLYVDNSIITNSKIGILTGDYSISSINNSAIYSYFNNIEGNLHTALNVRSSMFTYEIGSSFRLQDGSILYLNDSSIRGTNGTDIQCLNVSRELSTSIKIINSVLHSDSAITAINEMSVKVDGKTSISGSMNSKIMAEII